MTLSLLCISTYNYTTGKQDYTKMKTLLKTSLEKSDKKNGTHLIEIFPLKTNEDVKLTLRIAGDNHWLSSEEQTEYAKMYDESFEGGLKDLCIYKRRADT